MRFLCLFLLLKEACRAFAFREAVETIMMRYKYISSGMPTKLPKNTMCDWVWLQRHHRFHCSSFEIAGFRNWPVLKPDLPNGPWVCGCLFTSTEYAGDYHDWAEIQQSCPYGKRASKTWFPRLHCAGYYVKKRLKFANVTIQTNWQSKILGWNSSVFYQHFSFTMLRDTAISLPVFQSVVKSSRAFAKIFSACRPALCRNCSEKYSYSLLSNDKFDTGIFEIRWTSSTVRHLLSRVEFSDFSCSHIPCSFGILSWASMNG